MAAIGNHSEAPDFLVPDAAPACAGADITTFFPERESAAAAKSIEQTYCRRCPVSKGCKAWALRQTPDTLFGIWAGTNQRQRRALRRKASR